MGTREPTKEKPLSKRGAKGGEGGIRTREPFWVTRFPSVRAKPNYATSPYSSRGNYSPCGFIGQCLFAMCAQPLFDADSEVFAKHPVRARLRAKSVSGKNTPSGSEQIVNLHYCFTGRLMMTVNPLPCSLSARICPPWARTMDLAMASSSRGRGIDRPPG